MPSPVLKLPLKSTHHVELGPVVSAKGCVVALLVRILFWCGIVIPRRRKISPRVLGDGKTTCGLQFCSQDRSFFGPQVGCSFRAATIKSSSSSDTFAGLVRRSRERSATLCTSCLDSR